MNLNPDPNICQNDAQVLYNEGIVEVQMNLFSLEYLQLNL